MTDETRSVVLTDSQSAFVDDLIARGDYASPEDVLRAGVDALRSRERQVQNWLETEVFAVVDSIDEVPSRTAPAERVFEDLRARHDARFKGRA